MSLRTKFRSSDVGFRKSVLSLSIHRGATQRFSTLIFSPWQKFEWRGREVSTRSTRDLFGSFRPCFTRGHREFSMRQGQRNRQLDFHRVPPRPLDDRPGPFHLLWTQTLSMGTSKNASGTFRSHSLDEEVPRKCLDHRSWNSTVPSEPASFKDIFHVA